MPSPTASAPAVAGTQAREGGMSPMLKSIIQGLAIFFGMQLLMNNIFGKKPAQTTTTTDESGAVATVPANTGEIPPFLARPDSLDEGATYNQIPQRLAPMWPVGSALDIIIVVSSAVKPTPIASTPKEWIIMDEKNFQFGNYKENRVIDTNFPVPWDLHNNGTLWVHFFIGLSGSILDPSVYGYHPAKAYHNYFPLTQYIAKKKEVKTKNLLSGSDGLEEPVGEVPTGPIIRSHYHPNFTMSFIPDTGVMNYPSLHPAVRQYVRLEATSGRDGTGQNGWYYPVLFVNTFWQLKSDMTLMNSTVTSLPIHIDLNNLANWKFSLMASVDEGAKQTARTAAHGGSSPGGGDGSEFEMIKEIMLNTNIYLLSTTVVVSIFHMIFEMMAFKNDISHYRSKKNNVGISVRSILGNVFMQGIIFLYLLDKKENTSWMILFSQGMGIAIEFWKITTVVNVRIRPSPPNSLLPYTITFEDKAPLSLTEAQTKEYDSIAFKYLYLLAIPLLSAYAIYSLIYQTHKSWYSFVISTLVGSVYAYGFLMMVPSLYINYRLKSVAHMPAKAMMYKFLNTFIDDLFAFTIKMPLLHRLATLRDDVIFFVYLFQKWKYRVDYKRINEFGQGGADEEDEGKKEVVKAIKEKDENQDVRGVSEEDEAEATPTGSSGKEGKATLRK